ncbi:hypothetical protein JOD67_001288 [Tenggerimyces flavus]|nr:hypothetical protein [Tenggerimyces flavus]
MTAASTGLVRVAAACVALALAAIGCGGPSVELVVPNPDNRADSAIPSTKGLPYSFGDYMQCISADGSIEITEVLAEGSVGRLEISEFATRPNHALKGGGAADRVRLPGRTAIRRDRVLPEPDPALHLRR